MTKSNPLPLLPLPPPRVASPSACPPVNGDIGPSLQGEQLVKYKTAWLVAAANETKADKGTDRCKAAAVLMEKNSQQKKEKKKKKKTGTETGTEKEGWLRNLELTIDPKSGCSSKFRHTPAEKEKGFAVARSCAPPRFCLLSGWVCIRS